VDLKRVCLLLDGVMVILRRNEISVRRVNPVHLCPSVPLKLGDFLVLRVWVRVDPELNISLHDSIMLLANTLSELS
jgi:hypothetical protein